MLEGINLYDNDYRQFLWAVSNKKLYLSAKGLERKLEATA